jgi:hypothetical protein
VKDDLQPKKLPLLQMHLVRVILTWQKHKGTQDGTDPRQNIIWNSERQIREK